MYSCFYELFNQRFVESEGHQYCYMVHGTLRHFCKVHKEFKVIILTNKDEESYSEKDEDIELKQPSPFLNRFEKHLILLKNVMEDKDRQIQNCIENTIDQYFSIFNNINKFSVWNKHAVIGNFSRTTITSLVVDKGYTSIDHLWKTKKIQSYSSPKNKDS